jgi:hypothetical protein
VEQLLCETVIYWQKRFCGVGRCKVVADASAKKAQRTIRVANSANIFTLVIFLVL